MIIDALRNESLLWFILLMRVVILSRSNEYFFFLIECALTLFLDVLENAFTPLSDDDYEVAMKRVRELLDLDPDQEVSKFDPKFEVMWAVAAAFNK